MLQIVLLTFDGNVRTVLDQGGDCLNIFLKLADNADSGNVFHFLFHALHGNMLALHFLPDAGHAFHAAAYLLEGEYRSFSLCSLIMCSNLTISSLTASS